MNNIHSVDLSEAFDETGIWDSRENSFITFEG